MLSFPVEESGKVAYVIGTTGGDLAPGDLGDNTILVYLFSGIVNMIESECQKAFYETLL